MNKVLINLFVPILNTSYDVFIPLASPLHEVLNLIKKSVFELSEGHFRPNETTALCLRSTGEILDANKFIYELNIKNGTKLMLI